MARIRLPRNPGVHCITAIKRFLFSLCVIRHNLLCFATSLYNCGALELPFRVALLSLRFVLLLYLSLSPFLSPPHCICLLAWVQANYIKTVPLRHKLDPRNTAKCMTVCALIGWFWSPDEHTLLKEQIEGMRKPQPLFELNNSRVLQHLLWRVHVKQFVFYLTSLGTFYSSKTENNAKQKAASKRELIPL